MERGSLTVAFGVAVRKKRLEQGLSQERLAVLAGLHRAYVGFVERGEKSVTLETAQRLAAALGLSLSELICEAEGHPSDN